MAAMIRALLLVACALTASCARRSATPTVPKDVREFLGDRAVAVLQQPQRVEVYRVQGPTMGRDGKRRSADGPASAYIGDLLILAAAPEQDAAFGRAVAALFLSGDAYMFNTAKACMFLPDHVLRVHGAGGRVEFTLCFSCSEFHAAAFDDTGNRLPASGGTQHFDGVEGRLKALIDRAFAGPSTLATPRPLGGA